MAVFLGYNQDWPVGFMFFVFLYVQEHPKAQQAVVLVLKRTRRRGHGLKSHPTEWKKQRIKPASPGLQDIPVCLSLHHGGFKMIESRHDFIQCGMCDQRMLRPACAHAQTDQSLCQSHEYSMSVKLLTEHLLEFLS